MNLEIDTYKRQHKDKVLDLFKSNCPKYFNLDELDDFNDFLDNYADENFTVIKIDNEIIGCGGYYIKHNEKMFGIAWVMFKRYALGLSKFLFVSKLFFENILQQIESHKLPYQIVVNTSQLLEKTLHKFGFQTEQIIKNGFGENLDHYIMKRRICQYQKNQN